MTGSRAGELDAVRRIVAGAAAALEASRQRLDDLNVFPVPDGDTGVSLSATVGAVVEALDGLPEGDRPALARGVARAALVGARGNSGVILSQIVRGLVEVLGEPGPIDAPRIARAVRAASDAAYRGVRQPVEGTMLTVVRELAEEAEARASTELPPSELLAALVRRGNEAVERTPQLLGVLREAGVVDAGAAGLAELVRGVAAAVAGRPVAPSPAPEAVPLEAVHAEPSRFRYCTSFVVEGEAIDLTALEAALEPLGDSLLVVGDAAVVKVHVHTDDPGAALSRGGARGVLSAVEVADMLAQTVAREQRLLRALPEPASCAVVAVVSGVGNRRLYESLGATTLVDDGDEPPSADAFAAALARLPAREAILLPNRAELAPAAREAAARAPLPTRVVATRSLAAGLAAMVAFDATRSAADNQAAMVAAVSAAVTGAVARATRRGTNGARGELGEFVGSVGETQVASGPTLAEVAAAVVERLLAEPREVLTFLTRDELPQLDELLRLVARRHPAVEVVVRHGGQRDAELLVLAE